MCTYRKTPGGGWLTLCGALTCRSSRFLARVGAFLSAFMTVGLWIGVDKMLTPFRETVKSELPCLIPSANLLTLFVFDNPSVRSRERGASSDTMRCYLASIAADWSKLLGTKNNSKTVSSVPNSPVMLLDL